MPSVKQIKDIQANIVRLRDAFNSAVTGAHALGVYTELTIYQPENIATIETSIMIDPDSLTEESDPWFNVPERFVDMFRHDRDGDLMFARPHDPVNNTQCEVYFPRIQTAEFVNAFPEGYTHVEKRKHE